MSIEAMKQAVNDVRFKKLTSAIEADKNVMTLLELAFKAGAEVALSIMESREPDYKERQVIEQAEKQDDGYCQACDGEMCTAKQGCVALSNPQPQKPPVKTYCGGKPNYVDEPKPPKCKWQGLTDEEIDKLHGSPMELEHSGALKWVRIIEAKLKEKNND